MIYFLLASFIGRKKKMVELEPPETVNAAIARLEQLADHLETTAGALEALVERMREEEEVQK